MPKQRYKFTYTPDKIGEPLIYKLGKQFDVTTNIRRANVTSEQGWVILELEGTSEHLEQGLEWIRSQGVRIDPVEGDLIEG